MPPSTTSFGELSRNPASLAPRSNPHRWQKTGRSHTDSVAEREICCMGRNSNSCVNILINYIHLTAPTAGGAAGQAAERKRAKYANLPATHDFTPLAIESL